MNCSTYESAINDIARDQIVDASIRDHTLAHCSVCASCAQTLADQKALTVTLRSLARDWQSVAAPSTVPDHLILALRSQAVTTVVPPARYNWRYWAGPIAAVLLISLVFGAMRWRKEPVLSNNSNPSNLGVKPIEVQPPYASTLPQPQTTERPGGKRTNSSRSRPSKHRASRGESRRVTSTTVAADRSHEIATEFLPLGYSNASSLQDGGQIVRVEVPRSTLVSFGLPVNMNRVGQRVKADLLLGVDGSARAIRFVQ